MTTLKESISRSAKGLEAALAAEMEGMDYCLDWKPNSQEWSAREILWHVLEDPEGGIPRAIRGILDGSLPELTIIADETHMTPIREAMDLETIRSYVKDFFDDLWEVLKNASNTDLTSKKTSCWFPSINYREERTPQNLLEGLFLRHWNEHVKQLASIRQSLEMD